MWILRQVEAGRPVFDAAQHEMLDSIEAAHAPGEGVPDGAADVAQLEVLEQPQHLHVLARARFAQPGLQETPQPNKRVYPGFPKDNWLMQ